MGRSDKEKDDSPSSPQASLPDPCGPETRYPNSSCTTARCLGVNRCWYMWVFIAGQMTTGMEGDRARRRDDFGREIVSLAGGCEMEKRQRQRLTARVSHSPQAILASKSAEHGATTTRSVQRRNYVITTVLDTLTSKLSMWLHELTSMCKMGSPTFFQSYGPRLVSAISRHRLS